MLGSSWKITKFVTSVLLLSLAVGGRATAQEQNALSRILRQQVLAAGLTRSSDLYVNRDEDLVSVGKVIFASKNLSLNGNIACQTCHLSQFGSADGIPNAAAIGGVGEGPARLLSGAKLLPRNTLPFWGRGEKGFDTFFWDGKVDFRGGKRVSQFGSAPPSDDPLVTAAHLPVVEVREMLDEDDFVEDHMRESVADSEAVYQAITNHLRHYEPTASQALAERLHKTKDQLSYTDYARALASFIRSEFRIKKTKLERFAYESQPLSPQEVRGGLIFYGKGRCVVCHSGPYFSDFKFHVIPFPELGFGKNGFGVDYGHFNVTFDPRDMYAFRTPPLFNVAKTAPYGHSGSLETMQEAIVAHFELRCRCARTFGSNLRSAGL